ncbi:MAG: NlpC/P60 family protein [Armatimonas sp.]
MEFRALSRLNRLFAVLGTITLTSSYLIAAPEFPKTPGAFTASATTLRSQPSESAPKVATLGTGIRGEVVGHKGGWVKLRTPSGKTGWAPADRLALNEPAKELILKGAPQRRAAQIASNRGAGAPAPRSVASSQETIEATVEPTESSQPTLSEPPIEDLPETGGTPVAVENISIPSVNRDSRGDRLARKALSYRGWRYRWGATGNGAFDCSGLTQFLYAKEGKFIPRTAHEQFKAGQPIPKPEMQPGDLVFFRNTGRSGISHVGMFIGNGQFLHAAGRKKGVRVDDINGKYYVAHWAGARRF